MTVIINGTTGVTSPGGDTQAADTTINGVTVGKGAGAVSTNTAVGLSALAAANGSSDANTAIGEYALSVNTSGTRNTAVGQRAMAFSNLTGSNNTAIGSLALFSNTTASYNTAVGYQAGYTNVTGANNVYVGGLAAYPATGDNNVAIGYYAGGENNIGSSNVLIGNAAGQKSTGQNQTFVGQAAGYLITTGAKNTILGRFNGYQGGLDIRTGYNYAVISDGDGIPLISVSVDRTMALQGAVPVSGGIGITFPATQVPSSNANTLDDYEEGIFVPTFSSFTNTAGRTLTGIYTKIGRTVTIVINISQGTETLTSTANVSGILGLPFPVASNASFFAGIGTNYMDTINQGALLYANSTNLYTTAFTALSTRAVQMSGTYFV